MKPDWTRLNLHALEPANLGRVLATIGITGVSPPMPRGGCLGFEPVYERHRAWRLRYRDSDTLHAKGWRAGAWADGVEAWMDAEDARRRDGIAAFNRALARRPVRLCRRDDPRDLVWLDESTGEWAHAMGGARGDDLIGLGQFLLGVSWGKAGFRIARACGLAAIPVTREAQAA